MRKLVGGCAIGCGLLVVVCIVLAVMGVNWVRSTYLSPKPPDPRIGKSVALRPTFVLRTGGSYQAGTAVAVRLQPRKAPIVLTALHLFGPAGGLDKDLAPPFLDQVIREVLLTPLGAKKPTGRARGALRKTGFALKPEDPDVSSDIAAFALVPGSKVNALDLSATNPRLGEWVWLVGDVVDHQPQTQRLFPARVMVASDKGTMVKFESSFRLQAFSGAPLVNVKREVAGILIGGSEEGGMAVINPAASIRRRLAESGL